MTRETPIEALDLDTFRHHGDAVLDAPVAELPGDAVPRMLANLFRRVDLPTDDPDFRGLLDLLPPHPVEDASAIHAGQQLFTLFGPEVLLILGCYSLPAAYAAADGVQVIHRSRRLQDDARRRVIETAQMVLNVMSPGALEPGAVGHRSAVKVRLMHALVRRHVRDLREPTLWSEKLGVPINQEDLAGTLLTFSLAVVRGLRRIGCPLAERDVSGYLAAWRHIGNILGVDPRLAPTTETRALALARKIGARQFRASPEGQALASELVTVVDGLFPLPGYGTSLMHFFLEDSIFGVNLAEILDLPPPNWTRVLVQARALQKRAVLRWLPRVPGAVRRRRHLARSFAQHLIAMRSDIQRPFEIPTDHAKLWGLQP